MLETCKHGHPRTEENIDMTPKGRPECRPCRTAAAKRYHQDHRIERVHSHKDYQRQWYLDNQTRLCAKSHQKYWRDPEAHARQMKPHYSRHDETRRARKLNQFIEDVDPQTLYDMHGGMCGICKEFIVGDFHMDHVIPLSKGGAHGYINCQPAHPSCNLRKGAKITC